MAARQRHRQERGKWHTDAAALLATCEQPFHVISRATNIPTNWLWRFSKGRIPDPGVNRVECLYRYLLEAKRSA